MQLISGLVVCFAALMPAQDGEVVPLKKRAFEIPILVDPARRDEIDWLYLYVSRDKGNTWKKVTGVSPDKRSFGFSAPEDGLYWFAVQVVGKDRSVSPPSSRDMLPAQKVLVTTAARAPRSDREEIELIEKEQAELKARLKELEQRLEKLRARRKPKR